MCEIRAQVAEPQGVEDRLYLYRRSFRTWHVLFAVAVLQRMLHHWGRTGGQEQGKSGEEWRFVLQRAGAGIIRLVTDVRAKGDGAGFVGLELRTGTPLVIL